MSRKLVLPKQDKEGNYYLSYSQISKWKKSKREYIRDYFFGEDTASEGLKKYGEFGTRVGEALEEDNYKDFTKSEITFLKTIPRYDEFEREIRLEMDGFYVKGFIDTNSLESEYISASTNKGENEVGSIEQTINKLADYKTGDIEKKRADYESKDYNQLEIYAAAIEQETGNLPEDVKVFLIGRSGNAFRGEKLKLTKEFITITREINPTVIKKVKEEVQSIAEEISEVYQVFLKLKI